MARITEQEITDVDGRKLRVRTIEADIIEVEYPDGRKESIKDFSSSPKAEEWPWTPPGQPTEWRLFNVLHRVMAIGRQASPSVITLLSENREVLLKLGGITLGVQLSADAQDYLMCNELPFDN